MIAGLRQPLKALAGEATEAARIFLWRDGLAATALLIAALVTGFLLFGTFVGLRHLLGLGTAALVVGAALMLLAMALLLVARGRNRAPRSGSPHRSTAWASVRCAAGVR